MIFQTELTTLDTELSQLQVLLDAKRQQRSLFEELDAETNAAIEAVALLKTKIEAVSCDAIASLKSAVLTLFESGDNENDGGNQPTDPTPDTDPDGEPELLCLNGETGDCLTTADLENKPHPHKAELDGRAYEWATPFASPLTCLLWEDTPLLGQHRRLTSHWEHDWELEPLDGQSWEIATPLCCLLSDAPQQNKDNGTNEAEGMAYIELVTHPENKALAYQRKHNGEIVCVYVGFRTKAIAQSWMHFLEAITARVELRQALRMQGFKWETKVKGMSVQQIERLAKEAIDKTYRPEIGSAKPPTYNPRPIPQPVNPEEVGEGDIVTALLTPSASYKVIKVMPNGILDGENLTTGDRLGLRPAAVSLVQKGSKYPPCPFQEGDLVDWRGLKLRVAAVGVETLHCVLRTDPIGTKSHTRVPLAECVMSEATLEETLQERDARIAKENQQMLSGIAATVFDQKFQEQNTRRSMAATHGRQ